MAGRRTHGRYALDTPITAKLTKRYIIRAIQEEAPRYRPHLMVLYGSKGVSGADLTGCYRGRHFEIDIRKPGEEAIPARLERLQKWAAAGAITGVVHSAAEFYKLLKGR